MWVSDPMWLQKRPICHLFCNLTDKNLQLFFAVTKLLGFRREERSEWRKKKEVCQGATGRSFQNYLLMLLLFSPLIFTLLNTILHSFHFVMQNDKESNIWTVGTLTTTRYYFLVFWMVPSRIATANRPPSPNPLHPPHTHPYDACDHIFFNF